MRQKIKSFLLTIFLIIGALGLTAISAAAATKTYGEKESINVYSSSKCNNTYLKYVAHDALYKISYIGDDYYGVVVYFSNNDFDTGFVKKEDLGFPTAAGEYYYALTEMYMYKRPSASSDKWAKITPGTKIAVTGRPKGLYTQVKGYSGDDTLVGWVYTNTLATSSRQYETIKNGTYIFNSALGGSQVLDITNNNYKSGYLQTYKYKNNEAAQKFKVTALGNGWYKIASYSDSNYVLTAYSALDNRKVYMSKYGGYATQMWRFCYSGATNTYFLKNCGTGYESESNQYFLNAYGEKAQNNAQVGTKLYDGAAGMKWKLSEVLPYVPVTNVTYSKASVTIKNIGDSVTIKPTITPANATDKTLKFSTSDSNVAVVNSAGKVTGVGPGKAKIYATASNNKTYKLTTVTVKEGNIYYSNIKADSYLATKLSSTFHLDVKDNKATGNLRLYTAKNTNSQKFTFVKADTSKKTYYIRSKSNPSYLVTVSGTKSDGGRNVTLAKRPSANAINSSQVWKIYTIGGNRFLYNPWSHMYLDVSGGKAKNDTNVWAYPYNGSASQAWKIGNY